MFGESLLTLAQMLEDRMREMMQSSLRAPFNLDKAMKIAQVRFECTFSSMAYTPSSLNF